MISRVRILPLLILVAFLVFSLRIGEFVTDVRQIDGASFATSVSRSAVDERPTEILAQEGQPPLQLVADSTPVEEDASESIPLGGEWSDPASAGMDFGGNTDEVIQELMERRKDLQQRESKLRQQEAFLRATEQQVDQKLAELKMLREELRDLLNQQEKEEENRIKSLVKIYEGMKPKEAANIFNTLDMDIMLSVVGRMSERRSAPILAAMEPEKARTLTVLLAREKELPEDMSNF